MEAVQFKYIDLAFRRGMVRHAPALSIMVKPEFEQFGITKEQFDSIYVKKDKIRNYTFGISSAAGILAGCMFGIYLSKGVYETVLFILFFGCFLGSLFGGIFTMIVVTVYILLLYIFSPAYRSCRKYRTARSKGESDAQL